MQIFFHTYKSIEHLLETHNLIFTFLFVDEMSFGSQMCPLDADIF